MLYRDEIRAVYAGEPEAMMEALAELDEQLAGTPEVVGLRDPDRDRAWAALAREV